MKIVRYSLLIFLSSLITACSSFLYYPSRIKYTDTTTLRIPPEEIKFTDKLVAWHFKTAKKSKGVFVVFHGNAQNISTHFSTMYWVLEKGYDLFIFDYPGYGASAGSPTPKNTLDAGNSAIAYVQKTWPALPIIIMGQSLGGAIALRTIADLTERKNICAMIVDSSFDSYKKVGQSALSKVWFTWPLQWLPYLVLSDAYAPGDRIANISPLPLLVLHRKQDPVVSSKMSERVFAKAKEPKKLLLLNGSGHVNAFTDSDRVENQMALLDFIKVCEK